MKMWIARTKGGELQLFSENIKLSPYYRDDFNSLWVVEIPLTQEIKYIGYGVNLNPDLFPEVTFENSPKEVELVIKK